MKTAIRQHRPAGRLNLEVYIAQPDATVALKNDARRDAYCTP
jgi:hypothetical protein